LGNGDATAGAAMRQAFPASAGDSYAFDWVLLPELVENDFAFVAIDGVPVELADSFSAGNAFETFCFSVTSTGTTELAFGVVDVVFALLVIAALGSSGRQMPPADDDARLVHPDSFSETRLRHAQPERLGGCFQRIFSAHPELVEGSLRIYRLPQSGGGFQPLVRHAISGRMPLPLSGTDCQLSRTRSRSRTLRAPRICS
jgi:hypothetical protein